MEKIDRIRQIKAKILLDQSRYNNIGEIDLETVKEKRLERVKKSKNQRTKEKYAFKRSQLADEIHEENPLEVKVIDPYEDDMDFSDFSETLKAEAMSIKHRNKKFLVDKREYFANKELKRLAKVKRKNENIISEANRFIKHLTPLVNVWLDMDEITAQYDSLVVMFEGMEEVNRTPIVQFKKAYKDWLTMREKSEISKPLSQKALKYKLIYEYKFQHEEEADDDADLSEYEDW